MSRPLSEEKRPACIEGALYCGEVNDEMLVAVYPMLYTDRLCIGVSEFGYERAWCYPKGGSAVVAAIVWDGEGDPPDGWVKEVGTERRRVNGDPSREFDADEDPLGTSVGGREGV